MIPPAFHRNKNRMPDTLEALLRKVELMLRNSFHFLQVRWLPQLPLSPVSCVYRQQGNVCVGCTVYNAARTRLGSACCMRALQAAWLTGAGLSLCTSQLGASYLR